MYPLGHGVLSPCDARSLPCSILWSGLISSLKAQAAEWVRMPSPSTKAWHYTMTMSRKSATEAGLLTSVQIYY